MQRWVGLSTCCAKVLPKVTLHSDGMKWSQMSVSVPFPPARRRSCGRVGTVVTLGKFDGEHSPELQQFLFLSEFQHHHMDTGFDKNAHHLSNF